MSMLASTILIALAAAGVVASILLLLAPGEIVSLVAGWDRRNSGLPDSLPYYQDPSDAKDREPSTGAFEPDRYLVYLDGIGKTAPRDTRVARRMIERVAEVLPRTRIVGHVTPYSPLNRALSAHPRSGRWWRVVLRRLRLLGFLRNVTQTLVAADRRYQRAYHDAIAATIVDHLRASGYRAGSSVPVVLMGYSGGAQVAVGVADLVARALSTPPITVVSIGGVFDARNPLEGVEHLYHFRSRLDWLERLGALVFPGRWPICVRSGWNRARKAGRISVHLLRGARHFGRRGYLSDAPVTGRRAALGRSIGSSVRAEASTPPTQLDRTLRAVADVLSDGADRNHDLDAPAGRR